MPVHFSLADIDSETSPQREAIKMSPSYFGHSSPRKSRMEEAYNIDSSAANLFLATDIMLQKYAEKIKTIDDLLAINKEKSQKLEKAKRKARVFKAMLTKKSNQDLEAFEANKLSIKEAKQHAAVAVLEARILMASEAADNGQDMSIWDVEGWKNKLVKIKENFLPHPLSMSPEGCKAPKKKAAKVPKIWVSGEASSSKDEDMAVADDPVDSGESSGEDGI